MINFNVRHRGLLIGAALFFLFPSIHGAFAADDDVALPQQAEEESLGFFDRLFSGASKDIKQAEQTGKTGTKIPLPPKKPKFNIKHNPSNTDLLKKKAHHPLLSHQDARLYKKVFALQKQGNIEDADKVLKSISNSLLLGHVLAQRYLHPSAYTSNAEELQSWLADYADHPGAQRIYALALKKSADPSQLKKPVRMSGLGRVHEPTMRRAKRYRSNKKRNAAQAQQVLNLHRKVKSHIRKGQRKLALQAVKAPANQALLDQNEINILYGEISAAHLYAGEVNAAYKLAKLASSKSPVAAPKASWIAGLVSWKRKNYLDAALYFERSANSEYASGWLVTAASYWAARSNMRAGNIRKVSRWLIRGMEYPRTYYGLISTRALGQNFDFNWNLPTFTRESHQILSSTPAGARAVALAKAGQATRAQAELLRLKPKTDEEREAFLAFAGYAHLPALSIRVGSLTKTKDDSYYDGALYPLVPWTPQNGFIIDHALVHAVMKQESRFNPLAESHSGARGLMQLMPATAKGVDAELAKYVEEPEINMAIGQRYLKELLESPSIDNNLLYMLIAYNAGPGNLRKWRKRWPDVDDPLLFIELIPVSETRQYIEKVLANYWIYRLRAGKNIKSMEEIAAGRAAMYSEE